jgi:hypothetical protein
MSKGGFLSEMLASRRAHTDYEFLWRYVYYMYIGLPLLIFYFLLYQAFFVFVVGTVQRLLGLGDVQSFSQITWVHGLALLAVHLGVVLALYHFKVLPVLFVPVKYITSV